LQDNFNVYGSILEYDNDIVIYNKVCNEGIAMYLEGILMYIKIWECILMVNKCVLKTPMYLNVYLKAFNVFLVYLIIFCKIFQFIFNVF
jgi:hypothetical protein